MKFATGDIIEHMLHFPEDVHMVTTNSYINKSGALVMGRGAALALAQSFPDLPKLLGRRINHMMSYHVLLLPYELRLLGAFQVKHHYGDQASLGLIRESAMTLTTIATCMPATQFHLNYPGIGCGQRTKREVLPLLEGLPDNVTVWERT